MGQGQADIALSLLRDCARSGEWLCLKNLHLAVSWLPTLEKEVRLSLIILVSRVLGYHLYHIAPVPCLPMCPCIHPPCTWHKMAHAVPSRQLGLSLDADDACVVRRGACTAHMRAGLHAAEVAPLPPVPYQRAAHQVPVHAAGAVTQGTLLAFLFYRIGIVLVSDRITVSLLLNPNPQITFDPKP
jgi:hypothetical protein